MKLTYEILLQKLQNLTPEQLQAQVTIQTLDEEYYGTVSLRFAEQDVLDANHPYLAIGEWDVSEDEKRDIRNWMNSMVAEYEENGEIDRTKLGEGCVQDLKIYKNDRYDIPDEVWDIAHEVAQEFEDDFNAEYEFNKDEE